MFLHSVMSSCRNHDVIRSLRYNHIWLLTQPPPPPRMPRTTTTTGTSSQAAWRTMLCMFDIYTAM